MAQGIPSLRHLSGNVRGTRGAQTARGSGTVSGLFGPFLEWFGPISGIGAPYGRAFPLMHFQAEVVVPRMVGMVVADGRGST